MTLKTVRFYDTDVPVAFYEKRGWRGRIVLLMARCAAWLLRRCEYHTMLLIMGDRELLFPKEVQASIIDRFHSEDGSKPKRSVLRALFRDVEVPAVETPDVAMEHRYMEGRKNSDDPQKKAQGSARSLHRMGLTGREGRYKLDAGQHVAMELDAESVPESSLIGYAHQDHKEALDA